MFNKLVKSYFIIVTYAVISSSSRILLSLIHDLVWINITVWLKVMPCKYESIILDSL